MGNFGMLHIMTTIVVVKKNGIIAMHQRHANLDDTEEIAHTGAATGIAFNENGAMPTPSYKTKTIKTKSWPRTGARNQKGTSKNPHFIPTAALRKKFLAYISNICSAAKFFPRLAFGRTLNF